MLASMLDKRCSPKFLSPCRWMLVATLLAALSSQATLAQQVTPQSDAPLPATKAAQEHGMAGMDMSSGDEHAHMHHLEDPAQAFLMSESSGTSLQPPAWPMPMLMQHVGNWRLMWMGQLFLVETQQTGPRGYDKFWSTNWGMLSATHRLGGGAVMLRTMLSLEPLTITNQWYPLLFQTGETAHGKPIVDGQHPHDFVMELSIQYAHKLRHAVWDLYYAPVGDIALGPTAYPHRASALELPQAAIGHHWEDSTHIVNNIVTGGVSWRKLRVEASGFHGAEPDEFRWDIDYGAMNSYSGRVTVTPVARWVAQVSAAHLTHPEALEAGDLNRTTASVEYIQPRRFGNWWPTSLVWGRNYKTSGGYGTNSVLAETDFPIGEKNFFTGRYEWSQRDELFANDPELAEKLAMQTGKPYFDISAYTVGYTRDIGTFHNAETGFGANLVFYGIPNVLTPYYGQHPMGVNVYLRVRLKPQR
jgi:hypothetical protein